MGNVSYLRYVNSSANVVAINWDNVPAKTKTYLEDSKTDESHPLPTTVADLAKCFHDTKFIGYLTEEPLQMLLDISYHGCVKSISKYRPRIYYEYEGFNQINFVEFHPGSRECVLGETRFDFRRSTDEDDIMRILDIIHVMEKELEKRDVESMDKPSTNIILKKYGNAGTKTMRLNGLEWKLLPFDELIQRTCL